MEQVVGPLDKPVLVDSGLDPCREVLPAFKEECRSLALTVCTVSPPMVPLLMAINSFITVSPFSSRSAYMPGKPPGVPPLTPIRVHNTSTCTVFSLLF